MESSFGAGKMSGAMGEYAARGYKYKRLWEALKNPLLSAMWLVWIDLQGVIYLPTQPVHDPCRGQVMPGQGALSKASQWP